MNECDKSSRVIPEEMNEIRGWRSLFTNPKVRVGDTLAKEYIVMNLVTFSLDGQTRLGALRTDGRGNWVTDLNRLNPLLPPDMITFLQAGPEEMALAQTAVSNAKPDQWIDCASVKLTGAAIASQIKSWVLDTPEPTDEGQAFMALDVAAMMPPEIFQARMESFVREIREVPKSRGRVHLPARGDGMGAVRSGFGAGYGHASLRFGKSARPGGGCGVGAGPL